MRTITIEVTAEDIKKHGPRNHMVSRCATCPVAVAMTRAIGRKIRVNGVDWTADDWDTYMELPRRIQRLIGDIDDGRYPDPFSFPVEVP